MIDHAGPPIAAWAERARRAVETSRRTGDILPRKIYDIAGVDAPAEATDELQRNTRTSRPSTDVVFLRGVHPVRLIGTRNDPSTRRISSRSGSTT